MVLKSKASIAIKWLEKGIMMENNIEGSWNNERVRVSPCSSDSAIWGLDIVDCLLDLE